MSSNPYDSPNATGGPPLGAPPSQGMAIASLVTGIIGILSSCCCVFAVPIPIVAIVLGFVALSQIKAGKASGKNLAIAGISCGFAGILFAILGLVVGIGAQVMQMGNH